MNRKWMGIVVAVLMALPAAFALAQEPTPVPAPAPRARVRTRSNVFSFMTSRGRIGVLVNTRANPDSDKIGARLEAVTPGGPAAKAGLKAGDVITRFKGTSLAGATSEDQEMSGPGFKLIELAHELEPGDTVQVEYRRGNDTKKATLLAEDAGSTWTSTMPEIAPGFPHMGEDLMVEPELRMHLGGMPGGFEFCMGDSWCNISLVTLNPDLGEYFGTREGILVVKAPADSSLPLKSGDVILSIGGRKPTSTSHAMRILRSYEAGETVTIDILRKQKRSAISWKVPEERSFLRTPRPARERRPGRQEPSVFRYAPLVRVKPFVLRAI